VNELDPAFRDGRFIVEHIEGLGWAWTLKDNKSHPIAVSARFYERKGACEASVFRAGDLAFRAALKVE
jgi:hypothetical protein